MKREIDLTDDSIFSSHQNSFTVHEIVHRVPWNKNSKLWNRRDHRQENNDDHVVQFYLTQELEESDEIRSDFQLFTGTVSTVNHTNRNGALFTDGLNWISDVNWDTGTNTSYITRSASQTTLELFDELENSFYVYQTVPSDDANVKLIEAQNEKTDEYENFPTGRRQGIIKNRKKKVRRYYVSGRVRCKYCRALIKIKPWSKHVLCPDCFKSYYSKDKKNEIERHNGWMTRSQRRKKELITSRKIFQGIPWNDLYDKRVSMHYKVQKEIPGGSHFGDKIVVKYRGIDDERPGSNPWQPNGRIPQDYDEFFDNLSWKDVLNNRLNPDKSLLQE